MKRGPVASGTSSLMRNERLVEGPPSAIRLPPSVLLLLLAFLGACKDGIPIFERARPHSAHERYADGLERAGLATSALARDWLAAATSSIRQAVPVSVPFREVGYFAASEARAVAYAVKLRDGQRLVATAETSAGAPLTVFLDLFQQTADTANPLDLVASLDSATATASARLTHEARRDGVYVLRVQPELLRSGAYTLTLTTEPSLAFPVSGKSNKAVQSFFGAERDAGARLHKGIDIFAPRGTPVLAATRGVVRSISPNNLGGNVVWLSDSDRGQTLYYAHLDRHNVLEGQNVNVGDTLGFVGNTGNARTTPPHLHFGIYRRVSVRVSVQRGCCASLRRHSGARDARARTSTHPDHCHTRSQGTEPNDDRRRNATAGRRCGRQLVPSSAARRDRGLRGVASGRIDSQRRPPDNGRVRHAAPRSASGRRGDHRDRIGWIAAGRRRVR